MNICEYVDADVISMLTNILCGKFEVRNIHVARDSEHETLDVVGGIKSIMFYELFCVSKIMTIIISKYYM